MTNINKEGAIPFFINSNICLKKEDVSSVKTMLSCVAGNTGNSYITYSLIKTLYGGLITAPDIKSVYNYDFSKQDKDIEIINNQCAQVFLILQDQIRISESYGLKLPYAQIMDFCKKIKKPIVIAGLGANSFNGYDADFHKKLSKELICFLKFISDNTHIIGLRGYFTQEVLHKLGIDNTQVIGCPSFFENGTDRIIRKKPYSNDLKVLCTSNLPADNLLFPERKVILQDEKNIIKTLLFGERDFSKNNMGELLGLLNGQYRCFPNIEEWKNFVRGYDFVIGSRVHGAILSLNSGACAAVTNTDSRAREMCEFLNIPYLPEITEEKDLAKIYALCDIDKLNNNYPHLYENYVSFLSKNNLRPFDAAQDPKPLYIEQPSLAIITPDKGAICGEILSRFETLQFSRAGALAKKVFSIENKGKYKVLTIFGLEFKFLRKRFRK